ncbi:MAG: bifunctional DNA-formamidopyrimidine glycosylase/DNA-(apurinic or apyrimidinic site) lyase [Planctomycetota bacterium]|nr:bifunctional DNA-formamidopyrimidine glycosylase/DNA-(apurinic or apyrimidinic site) lyase [Planctomycetota bacterium]
MPELPEVESVVRALAPMLTGRSVKNVRVLNRSTVAGSPRKPSVLEGRRVERVLRRGKYIVVHFDEAFAMAVHLRMTGWLGVKTQAQVAEEQDKFVRMVFELDEAPGRGAEWLLFRDIRKFGRVWCGRREEIIALKSFNKLGPEPLAITPEAFAERLHAHRGRLKSLLLNQAFLAGLGNIYADEALFEAGLHPLALAQQVKPDSARRLHAAIQAILGKAISAGGSSIDDYLHPDGTPGWFQRELKAYGREGEPCTRCKAPIKRDVVGQRGTWYCAKCQKKR